MQPDQIQRHPDGSIDFDFYRNRARLLRRDTRARILSWRPIAGLLKIRRGQMHRPPSTSSATPVMNSASSEAR